LARRVPQDDAVAVPGNLKAEILFWIVAAFVMASSAREAPTAEYDGQEARAL